MRFKLLLIFKIIFLCSILVTAPATIKANSTSDTTIIARGSSGGGSGGGGGGGGGAIDTSSDYGGSSSSSSSSVGATTIREGTDNNNSSLKFTLINTNNIRTDKSPSTPSYPLRIPRRPPRVCAGVHVRNDLKSFEQLRGCNIIDGPLTIALVSNQTHPFESKDYDNITFPDLNEVTEYLLFFRVQGLTTLSRLFPNLAVIRGKNLFSNYALIIYEMMHLQKINLPKLSDILRGSVRIERNPDLCYVSTVNWEGICKLTYTPHFFKNNNARCDNQCPDNCRPWNLKSNTGIISTPNIQGDVKELGSENNRSIFCWSNQVCHQLCQNLESLSLPIGPNGGCCSSECAGGCYLEDRPDQCLSCRSVSYGDTCVKQCDSNLYEYKGRCIKEQECIQMTPQTQCDESNLKAVLRNHLPDEEKNNKCQAECPNGFEEDPINKNKCKACDKGKCKKVCTPERSSDSSIKPFMVTNINSLRELNGCNVINGSLEISMKGGKNVIHELETVFSELEEIKGYLKITRSYPILTLGFLSKLKAINGSELDRGHYSLIIIDNPNLEELFMFNKSDTNQKQLNVLNGKIFAHLNPKLCPHRIDIIKSYASIADWDERDVSIHSNGDKEACSTQKLDVKFIFGTANLAIIRFENFAKKMEDPRQLLYYLVNYREASYGNVTMFDGRDGCNSQNDVWITEEAAPLYSKSFSNKSDDFQDFVFNVKPATRYALYVKTFTTSASIGALSEMIYFDTAPDKPSVPKQIESSANDHQSVTVSWSPPSRPNGIIKWYSVTITIKPNDPEDFQNACDSIETRDRITESITNDEPVNSQMLATTQNVNNSARNPTTEVGTCTKASLNTDVDIHAEIMSFQDYVIDIVYLKPNKPVCAAITNSTKPRRRRSFEYANYGSSSTTTYTSPNLESSNLGGSSSKNETKTNGTSIAANYTTHQHDIKFNRSLNETRVNVTVYTPHKPDHRFSYKITGLDHFTRYTIEVMACHGDFIPTIAKTSPSYNKCSLQAVTQVRTQPLPDNDKVLSHTISLNPYNESSSDNIITWIKPEKPNGLIYAYRVRYRPKSGNSDIWTEGCINTTVYERDRGFILSDINPGVYLLSVQTISMYSGQRYWSDPPFEFEIPQNYLVSPMVMFLLAFIGIILFASSVAYGTYYYQKKRHDLTNGLIYASVNPDYIQYDPDEWEVEKENLIIDEEIGKGSFGMVYKGQLLTEKGALRCAIKTVPPTSTPKQRVDFLREASIMKQFDTYHVIKLMGVISTSSPVYVIMEYMENGDLKKFLYGLREVYQQEKKTLVDGIYLMAAQIADGMAYLASKKFVHRDLAARNCMVGENRVVKIGDFGLARDVYDNDYYRRDTQGKLPVRWMSPESLKDSLYTSASDVWSFGIVVWEMVTFSASPYQGLSNDEVIKRVIQGHTMARPENCPDKLFYIMERCWKRNAKDRPTFNDIVEYLLPETKNQLYPNCFYRKRKNEGDSITQPIPEEGDGRTESFALLSWPSGRSNGLTNGVNHNQSDTSMNEKKLPLS